MANMMADRIAQVEADFHAAGISFVHAALTKTECDRARKRYEFVRINSLAPAAGARFIAANAKHANCEHASVLVVERRADIARAVLDQLELIPCDIGGFGPVTIYF